MHVFLRPQTIQTTVIVNKGSYHSEYTALMFVKKPIMSKFTFLIIRNLPNETI